MKAFCWFFRDITEMKKLLGFLAKIERGDENFYKFEDASQPGDSEKNIYRYYRFDSDELDRVPGRRTRKSWEPSKDSVKTSSSPIFTPSFNDSLDEEPEMDCSCVKNNPDSKSLDFSDSGSVVTVVDNFSSFERQLNDESRKDGCKKNTFVLNINNSKYFHIGSQKTININKNLSQTVQNRQFVDDRSSQCKTDFRKLLDCEEKLSEGHISLISQHINDRWKELVKNLGLDEPFLEMLEMRNDHNRTLTVYDALQKHVTLFPNTSVGFLVNVLLQIQNVTLVEKLALELKAD